MKPTKRDKTYLQSFGKAFTRKPVGDDMNALCKALMSEAESIKRLGITIAPIDCGIDMVTVNQLNRIFCCEFRNKRAINFESMENPEQVEC